ncbi:hypothetical protein FO519_005595 [Halicephalobus sp. NKZ332]|nr:hypothetical protein FO519_005595 [Halicephalobus sp. NKZ332]
MMLSRRNAVSLAFNKFGSDKNRSQSPLVIGHGLFGQKTNWNSVGKQLQRRLDNQVYVLDFRNHGDSPHSESMSYPEMAEDVFEFVKKVLIPESGFETFHLLGHSMGGKVAALFALNEEYQKFLETVIIEDISPISESRNIHFRRYIEHMVKTDLSKSRKEIGEDLAHVVTDLPTRQFLLTNLTMDEQTRNLKWKPNLEAIGNHIEHVLRFTIDSGAFGKPTLFVYGEKSGYIKEKDFETISRLFPQVQFKSIPNAGHWAHADNPSAFVDFVVDFIQNK